MKKNLSRNSRIVTIAFYLCRCFILLLTYYGLFFAYLVISLKVIGIKGPIPDSPTMGGLFVIPMFAPILFCLSLNRFLNHLIKNFQAHIPLMSQGDWRRQVGKPLALNLIVIAGLMIGARLLWSETLATFALP